MNTDRLQLFAATVRHALQAAEVSPRRVLLRRLREHSMNRRTPCRLINVETQPRSLTPVQPSTLHSTPFRSDSVSSSPPAGLTEIPHRPAGQFPPPLPVTCPGCGALSQGVNAEEPGFYTRSRKAVKAFLKSAVPAGRGGLDGNAREGVAARAEQEPATIHEHNLMRGTQSQIRPVLDSNEDTANLAPICDRCHDLVYNSRGKSIAHPTIEALSDSIDESPFSRNHVYHVLDAVDFPMSLIPSIYTGFSLARPRSQNRRSQHTFSRKPTVSFIITRSDLLGPTKEMVDTLMPYFQSVLRTALGRSAQDTRLGNVHLVSAKRGWWTTDIKNSIWERGGGNWMVGKVNVGKSNLFEVLFPKGSEQRTAVDAVSQSEPSEGILLPPVLHDGTPGMLSEDSLLPPPQQETPFPTMPLVSSLPGTTASPIRLPFGRHKGELIDLPGLERGNLEDFVQPDHKLDLVMTHRPSVTQHIIKPGQSLLLGGGLLRITPLLDEKDPSTTMLAYPFVPIDAHVTATDKAIGTQMQERESGIVTILAEEAGEHMASAGVLDLNHDVTKARAGPLLRAGVPASRLPFRVYSTDILIEGVGWVELVCQTRRRPRGQNTLPDVQPQVPAPPAIPSTAPTSELSDQPALAFPPSASVFTPFTTDLPSTPTTSSTTVSDPPTYTLPIKSSSPFPQVEIFTPNGKHIAQRPPLGAWQLWNDGKRRRQRQTATTRPRKPMQGAKKREKTARRAMEVLPSQ